MVESIEQNFPGLRETAWRVTSEPNRNYNCVAWAVRDTKRWWWPEPGNSSAYWPDQVTAEETITSFAEAFSVLGFRESKSDSLELGVEKIALFGIADLPTHAARQLPNGSWTSKLGALEDVEHPLRSLEGDVYGTVVRVFERPTSSDGLQ